MKVFKYDDESKQEIIRHIKKYTGKVIDPIERREYDDHSSFVFLYRNKEVEVFSKSKNKNTLFNRVISELKSKIFDEIFSKF